MKDLFRPIQIGGMLVKNRIVMSPMGVNFGVDGDGMVTEQLSQYLLARARGGTGMIVVGGGAVQPSGLDLPALPRLWDDCFIPSLKKMTDLVHRYDVKFGMQLLHGGRQTYHDNRVAPSPVPAEGIVKGIPRELTIVEIRETIESFGDSARRCQDSGFDFVEVHGAHGYLVTQFLAPNSNKRTDEYGGCLENRIRFLLEIVRNIKRKCGAQFPVGIRINGDDYIKNGWTIQDTKKIAPILELEGADYLHISAGIYGSFPPGITIPSMYAEQGCFLHLADEVKRTVHVPVIAVGRIKNPIHANRIIRDGKADMVSMGRAHLADPDLANKAKAGRLSEIRPCIGCCMGCIHQLFSLAECTCVMNPAVNREYLLKEIEETKNPKRILVIGAGPAGLAFSRLAGLRGHKVTIVEEQSCIGGMVRLAAIPPGRSDLLDMIKYFERELNRIKNVEIRLNVSLDNKMIDEIRPEAAVLASGSLPGIPHQQGLFDTAMAVHTVIDVLEETSVLTEPTIILGGGQAGLQVADFLAERGTEVVVLNRERHFASEMPANDRVFLMERLKTDRVKLYKDVQIHEFLPNGATFYSGKDFHTVDGFDHLVISEGMKSTRHAADLLRAEGIELHIIGDAKNPRSLLESQSEADELGRTI